MKAKITALFVTLAGILCFVMQKMLLSKMDGNGLLPNGHFTSYVIAGGILAVVVALGLYLWKGSAREYRICLRLPVQAVGCVAAAFAMVYWALTAGEDGLFLLFKVVAAVCFLALAVFRFKGKKPPLLILALIAVSMMALCFGQYRVWSRYTQLYEYLFPALSALLLTLYTLECCTLEQPEKNYKKAFILNQASLFCTIACLSTPLWPYYLAMAIWLLCELFIRPGCVTIPLPVQKCMQKLEFAGYKVYVVGGCVRDCLLGLTPGDYDLCTDAAPEKIAEVFSSYELVLAGQKHGTIGVVMDGKVYEITTFRTEGGYADNRHPDSVSFVNRVEEDLGRRDYTINAIAYHPRKGFVDPYGGEKDLFAGVLRAVGDPEKRFEEDSLRILRGVRFACRFRLKIEPKTRKAMKKQVQLMKNLAPERVLSELTQILCHMEQEDLVRFRDVIVTVIPQLQNSVGFAQHNPYHAYDVYTHTDRVLAGTPRKPALRWAALLHDVAKPETFTQDASGKGHFYGHAKQSAQMAEQILTRLHAANALKEQVVFLIEHHMDMLTEEKASLRRKLSRYGSENLKNLIKLQQADKNGKGKKPQDYADSQKLLDILDKLEKDEGRLQIRDLAVNGHDLMELGFSAGPELGQCQKKLLEQVLEEEIPNEKEALLAAAKQILYESGNRPDA